MKNFLFLLISLTLSFTDISFSQKPTMEWIKEFRLSDPLNRNFLSDMVLDDDNNIYVTGYAEDVFTLKYDPNGNLLWKGLYNDFGTIHSVKVRVDKYGNTYVAGYNNPNWYVIKYDRRGTQLWVWKKEGWGTSNRLYAMEVTDSGEIYVGGGVREQFGPPTREFKTIKLSTDGDTLWSRVVPYDKYLSPNAATAMSIDKSNNLIVSGTIWTSLGGWNNVTVKYTKDGDLIWQNNFSAPDIRNSYPIDIKISKENNIYISSECSSPDPSYSTNIGTIKLDSNGILLWYRLFSSPPGISSDAPKELVLDSNENVYITGYTSLAGEDYNFCTLKYDKFGNLLWERFYNNKKINRWDFSESIALDNKNNVYVTGISDNSTYSSDVTTIKYDTDGNLQWMFKYPDIPFKQMGGSKIKLDKNENILVGGNGYNFSDSLNRILIVKYSNQVNISPESTTTPIEFKLYQNYPNPFNPVTKIKFDISKASNTELKIYDVSGKLMVEIVNKFFNAGTYEVPFDGRNLSSGIYFYSLLINNEKISTRKMILMK